MAFATSQHRFPTFTSQSLTIRYPLPATTSYSRGTHNVITCSSLNFFEKSKMKEKEIDTFFSYVFYNGKKNGSDIFGTEFKRNFLFHYFDMYWEFDVYLFNIVLIIATIIIANNKRVTIMASIVLIQKNHFDTLQKIQILDHFLMKKIKYLVMFMMILFKPIDIKQFLLYYDYIYIYKLYMNMVLFDYYHKQNMYKKITNIHNSNTKFFKNMETSPFSAITKRKTSDNIIIITSKHIGMFTYFLKFFKPLWVSCSFIFLFFCSTRALFGMFHLRMEQKVFAKHFFAQGYHIFVGVD